MNNLDKGKQFGSCNVTHCQKKNSAYYFNRATNAYYCRDCAIKIYRENLDLNLELFDVEQLRRHPCLTPGCESFTPTRDRTFCLKCISTRDNLNYFEN